MRKDFFLIVVLAVLLCGLHVVTFARGPRAKYKHADQNKDGVVTQKEWRMEKRWEREQKDLDDDGLIDAKERRLSWRYSNSKVNTSLERKYDGNGDGWLEPSEVKEMLGDRYAIIQTNGKAKVDTSLEAEYDQNGDGIIDIDEAQDLKNDLDLD